MTTLEFDDKLTENPFKDSNRYNYYEIRNSGMYFDPKGDNYPFIMTSQKHGKDATQLNYSMSSQFNGRLLTMPKIKEVINSAPLPLYFNIKDKTYLIGKGFLAH